jgi:hypothetical protein
MVLLLLQGGKNPLQRVNGHADIVDSKTYGVVGFFLRLVSSVPNVASFSGFPFLIALSVFYNIYIHCSVLMYTMKYYLEYRILD